MTISPKDLQERYTNYAHELRSDLPKLIDAELKACEYFPVRLYVKENLHYTYGEDKLRYRVITTDIMNYVANAYIRKGWKVTFGKGLFLGWWFEFALDSGAK